MEISTGILGFGEAAQAFIGDDRWCGRARAFDIKTTIRSSAPAKLADYAAHSVAPILDLSELCRGTQTIFSLVTADQSQVAAEAVASAGPNGIFYLDMNSVAPRTKQATASILEQQGATYIDVAIMAPVHPAKLDVKLLVSGPSAARGKAILLERGFQNVEVVGTQIGNASAIKMIRSIMIKGMEALTAECLSAARAAGIVPDLLRNLGDDWTARADYNFDRMFVHGTRRAAEMKEVCLTLTDLGIDPRMSRGTVGWQEELGSMRISEPPASLDAKLNLLHQPSKVGAT